MNYLVIIKVFNHNYYHLVGNAVKGQNEAFPLFVMIRPIINLCQASMNITVLLLWAKWKVIVIESEIKGYKWNWVFPAWGHLEDWDCNHYCCGWQSEMGAGVYCVSLMKKYGLDIAKVRLMARVKEEKERGCVDTERWTGWMKVEGEEMIERWKRKGVGGIWVSSRER